MRCTSRCSNGCQDSSRVERSWRRWQDTRGSLDSRSTRKAVRYKLEGAEAEHYINIPSPIHSLVGSMWWGKLITTWSLASITIIAPRSAHRVAQPNQAVIIHAHPAIMAILYKDHMATPSIRRITSPFPSHFSSSSFLSPPPPLPALQVHQSTAMTTLKRKRSQTLTPDSSFETPTTRSHSSSPSPYPHPWAPLNSHSPKSNNHSSSASGLHSRTRKRVHSRPPDESSIHGTVPPSFPSPCLILRNEDQRKEISS